MAYFGARVDETGYPQLMIYDKLKYSAEVNGKYTGIICNRSPTALTKLFTKSIKRKIPY